MTDNSLVPRYDNAIALYQRVQQLGELIGWSPGPEPLSGWATTTADDVDLLTRVYVTTLIAFLTEADQLSHVRVAHIVYEKGRRAPGRDTIAEHAHELEVRDAEIARLKEELTTALVNLDTVESNLRSAQDELATAQSRAASVMDYKKTLAELPFREAIAERDHTIERLFKSADYWEKLTKSLVSICEGAAGVQVLIPGDDMDAAMAMVDGLDTQLRRMKKQSDAAYRIVEYDVRLRAVHNLSDNLRKLLDTPFSDGRLVNHATGEASSPPRSPDVVVPQQPDPRPSHG